MICLFYFMLFQVNTQIWFLRTFTICQKNRFVIKYGNFKVYKNLTILLKNFCKRVIIIISSILFTIWKYYVSQVINLKKLQLHEVNKSFTKIFFKLIYTNMFCRMRLFFRRHFYLKIIHKTFKCLNLILYSIRYSSGTELGESEFKPFSFTF